MAVLLRRQELAVFLPCAVLLAFWVGGEAGLLALTVGLPLAVVLARQLLPLPQTAAVSDQVIDRLDAVLRDPSQQTGCLVLQFDDPSWLCDRHGRARQSEILAGCIARIRGSLRPGDMLFPLEDGSLVVVLGPTQRLDLEAIVRIAGRLQLVAQQPMLLGDTPVQATCCIGFCLARQLESRAGKALLEAAQVAVDEAMRHRPGAIRAYSTDLALARAARDSLRAGFATAVAAGQIRAHFQPQLSTDSGAVSGMEALARWHHPDRGCLTPGEFLPAIEGTDLMEILGQEMLSQSLAALADWDRAGFRVPTVAVNFSAQDLRDPHLPERVGWALDRQDMAPERLTVEVLETVVALQADDIIARNIARLSDMGCGVDLDDFGTGNASITSIRNFALRRLKIDRSFVRAVDRDRQKQKLVTAILSLAEDLGLETLAEGVETQGEHAMLAQLGCGHVQGYVIARPLPPEEVVQWLSGYRDQLAKALRINVKAR
ncbi:EAL domain-containing protein [Tabrizicola sp.]|uniref:EAL domain-containing protein n=1 Tax=Tabrizicola sp. TaxID=2005166 RepID=UPI0026267233|nr:EAL domain-containing protein [Tabrizicola sp.]MDM7933183.1 EAL domain-containing protein [Tabrizicola sp.]